MRARSALFTLFGDVVRPAGGEAWLTTLTGCMSALGFTSEATRTTLHRMAGEGWVQPRRAGRYAAYRLTRKGVDRLEEAAARIYRLRSAPWDGRWHLLISPAGRDDEVARLLRWTGFGRLAADLWVSPRPHDDAALGEALHGGEQPPVRLSAAVADDDADIVRRAWDLEALRAAHAEFLRAWTDVPAPPSQQEAFTVRIRLVHHWRSFLFLDPGLPPELLPADWLGEDAADCFHRLYEEVAEPAWAFYEELSAQAPGASTPVTAERRRGDGSSLTPGLQAPDTRRRRMA